MAISRVFSNSKNPFLRKGEALAFRMAKAVLSRDDTAAHPSPPALANSFPKSGTHLLRQILAALPGTRDWGEFFVSAPSLSMREVPPEKMSRALSRLVPAELALGHVFWSTEAAAALGKTGAVHYFIYRDPRDVVVSEIHYVTRMNRWHRLHKTFASLRTDEERIRLSILGSPALSARGIFYPDIAGRFGRYSGWLDDPSVLSLRYEDLTGPQRTETIRRVVRHYLTGCSASGSTLDEEQLVSICVEAIDPNRSHTYRSGGSGGWRKAFTPEHKDLVKEVAGQLLVDLGYEANLAW